MTSALFTSADQTPDRDRAAVSRRFSSPRASSSSASSLAPSSSPHDAAAIASSSPSLAVLPAFAPDPTRASAELFSSSLAPLAASAASSSSSDPSQAFATPNGSPKLCAPVARAPSAAAARALAFLSAASDAASASSADALVSFILSTNRLAPARPFHTPPRSLAEAPAGSPFPPSPSFAAEPVARATPRDAGGLRGAGDGTGARRRDPPGRGRDRAGHAAGRQRAAIAPPTRPGWTDL